MKARAYTSYTPKERPRKVWGNHHALSSDGPSDDDGSRKAQWRARGVQLSAAVALDVVGSLIAMADER